MLSPAALFRSLQSKTTTKESARLMVKTLLANDPDSTTIRGLMSLEDLPRFPEAAEIFWSHSKVLEVTLETESLFSSYVPPEKFMRKLFDEYLRRMHDGAAYPSHLIYSMEQKVRGDRTGSLKTLLEEYIPKFLDPELFYSPKLNNRGKHSALKSFMNMSPNKSVLSALISYDRGSEEETIKLSRIDVADIAFNYFADIEIFGTLTWGEAAQTSFASTITQEVFRHASETLTTPEEEEFFISMISKWPAPLGDIFKAAKAL